MRQFHATRQYNCLPPQQPTFLLMAWCPEEPSDDFPMVAPADGLSLQAAFVHRETGEIQRRTTINLVADQKIYLFRSTFEQWFFIAQRDNYRSRYGCSCRVRFCEHVRQLIALEARA